MQTSEDTDRVGEPSSVSQPPEEPAAKRSGARWSWWWAFPILLVVWIGYGAMRRSSAESRQEAEKLVAQSLASAQARNYSGCLDAARQAVKLAPGYAEAHNNAGWCAANLGKWDDAIASLREAIRLQPNFIVAKNNLSWAESQRGASNAPLSPADTALLESLREAQGQRYPACIDAARHAIELKPNFPEAYNNLGYCTGVMGKLDEGIGYIHKALELRRDFPLASGNLSWMEASKARLRANGKR